MKTYTLYYSVNRDEVSPLVFGEWEEVADYLEEHLDRLVGWIHESLEGEEQQEFEIWHEYAREYSRDADYMLDHLEMLEYDWFSFGILEQTTADNNVGIVEKLNYWINRK